MVLYIYLAGFIVAYIILRAAMRADKGEAYTWSSVALAFFASLFSWIVVAMGLIITIILGIEWMAKKTHPPRWL